MNGELKFLVVDNSISMRKITVNTLKNLGYTNIIEAENGSDATSKFNQEKPGFILTAWNMVNGSGIEFVKSVRTFNTASGVPILMITTRGMKNQILEALNARVDSYIIKPFTPQHLKEKIENLIN